MYIQFKLSLDTVIGHCGVDKGLHQDEKNKIINSVILQSLVLQLVFSSVTSSANSFISSAV